LDPTVRAREYAPVEPLDVEPSGPAADPIQREQALRDALRGVQLGEYDERIIRWILCRLDNWTLRVVVSLLERTRDVAVTDFVKLEDARHRAPRPISELTDDLANDTGRYAGVPMWGLGNSGPGGPVSRGPVPRTALTDLTNVDLRETEKGDGERSDKSRSVS